VGLSSHFLLKKHTLPLETKLESARRAAPAATRPLGRVSDVNILHPRGRAGRDREIERERERERGRQGVTRNEKETEKAITTLLSCIRAHVCSSRTSAVGCETKPKP